MRRLGNLLCTSLPCAGWSPDGEQIAYVKDNELRIARNDGTDVRKLVRLDGELYWPRWSPDGRTIRFTFSVDKRRSLQLWEVSAEGSHLHAMFPALKREGSCCGSWTPDGKFFIFNSDSQIWAVKEQRTPFKRGAQKPIQLTAGPIRSLSPIFQHRWCAAVFVTGYKESGIDRVRPEIGKVEPFAWRVVGGGPGIFRQRQVGHVCYCSRGSPLA